MKAPEVPNVHANTEVVEWIARQCESPDALERAESTLLAEAARDPFLQSSAWLEFRDLLLAAYEAHDHVVVRGLPVPGGGVSLMWAVRAISSSFRTYRGGRVVKHFRMSPWTTDLSHTTQEGHFHTDLNTADAPPDITAMQCLCPDPGGAGHGVLRVARLTELLSQLRAAEDEEALVFLHNADVEMASETEEGIWRGKIVSDERIRYHPETIRAAARRTGRDLTSIESVLARIHKAALAASAGLDLSAGDALIVSNTDALHYRSACTVKFNRFPRDFETREVYVLHALRRPIEVIADQ